MDRRVQEDGTIIIGGQIVPQGGSQPTIASVVSYAGNTGLQSTNVEAALDELDNEKAPLTHTHDDRYFTEVEVTNLLASKSDVSHNHDTRYYTESEVDAKIVVINNALAGKSDVGHNHDDRYYTEAEVNDLIAEALGTVEAHNNPSFDIVEMSTDGPGDIVVPARLAPSGWSNFWSNGTGTATPDIRSDNTETRYGSGYSVRYVLPEVGSGVALQSNIFAVSPGSVVSIEGWVKGTGGPEAYLTLYTNQDVDPGFFVPGNAGIDTQIIKPGATWQKVQATFTVPTGHNRATIYVRGYGGGGSAAPGSLWWDETKSRVQIFPPSGVVTGEMKQYPAGTAPPGYLEANGGTFSATLYPKLAALYGDKYGTHSGDTYYLPKKIRTLPDTDWVTCTLVGAWQHFDSSRLLQYRRFNGEVEFQGLVKGGTGAITNLPIGFRPKATTGAERHFAVEANAAHGTVRVWNTNGVVDFPSGSNTYVDLSTVQFAADDIPGTIMTIIKAD